jgi:hypothetical protein
MKKTLLLLAILPTVLIAQKTNYWQLFTNNKIVLKGAMGSIKNCSIDDIKTTSIKFIFFPGKNAEKCNSKLIVMDTERHEIASKNIDKKDNILVIEKALFKTKENATTPIVVYVVQTSTDAALAAKMRVRPMELVKLSLK